MSQNAFTFQRDVVYKKENKCHQEEFSLGSFGLPLLQRHYRHQPEALQMARVAVCVLIMPSTYHDHMRQADIEPC